MTSTRWLPINYRYTNFNNKAAAIVESFFCLSPNRVKNGSLACATLSSPHRAVLTLWSLLYSDYPALCSCLGCKQQKNGWIFTLLLSRFLLAYSFIMWWLFMVFVTSQVSSACQHCVSLPVQPRPDLCASPFSGVSCYYITRQTSTVNKQQKISCLICFNLNNFLNLLT